MSCRMWVILGWGVFLSSWGCGKPVALEQPGAAVIINEEYCDKLRYPGEVAKPEALYERAYRNARKNITVENMVERLSHIEGNVKRSLGL